LLKALIIIVLVIAVLVGGLLTLRNSGRSGMPNDEVLKRAAKRAREQAAAEEQEDAQPRK
jgi:FtsZ-interacting cell division protein ZipA